MDLTEINEIADLLATDTLVIQPGELLTRLRGIMQQLPQTTKSKWLKVATPMPILHALVTRLKSDRLTPTPKSRTTFERDTIDCVRFLIKSGADVNQIYKRYNWSVLHMAVNTSDKLHFLIKYLVVNEGASIKVFSNGSRKLALHYACVSCTDKVHLLNQLQTISFLIPNYEAVTDPIKTNETLLHLFCDCSYPAVKFFWILFGLRAGVNPSIKSNKGEQTMWEKLYDKSSINEPLFRKFEQVTKSYQKQLASLDDSESIRKQEADFVAEIELIFSMIAVKHSDYKQYSCSFFDNFSYPTPCKFHDKANYSEYWEVPFRSSSSMVGDVVKILAKLKAKTSRVGASAEEMLKDMQAEIDKFIPHVLEVEDDASLLEVLEDNLYKLTNWQARTLQACGKAGTVSRATNAMLAPTKGEFVNSNIAFQPITFYLYNDLLVLLDAATFVHYQTDSNTRSSAIIQNEKMKPTVLQLFAIRKTLIFDVPDGFGIDNAVHITALSTNPIAITLVCHTKEAKEQLMTLKQMQQKNSFVSFGRQMLSPPAKDVLFHGSLVKHGTVFEYWQKVFVKLTVEKLFVYNNEDTLELVGVYCLEHLKFCPDRKLSFISWVDEASNTKYTFGTLTVQDYLKIMEVVLNKPFEGCNFILAPTVDANIGGYIQDLGGTTILINGNKSLKNRFLVVKDNEPIQQLILQQALYANIPIVKQQWIKDQLSSTTPLSCAAYMRVVLPDTTKHKVVLWVSMNKEKWLTPIFAANPSLVIYSFDSTESIVEWMLANKQLVDQLSKRNAIRCVTNRTRQDKEGVFNSKAGTQFALKSIELFPDVQVLIFCGSPNDTNIQQVANNNQNVLFTVKDRICKAFIQFKDNEEE